MRRLLRNQPAQPTPAVALGPGWAILPLDSGWSPPGERSLCLNCRAAKLWLTWPPRAPGPGRPSGLCKPVPRPKEAN